jgi:hypothetical protein
LPFILKGLQKISPSFLKGCKIFWRECEGLDHKIRVIALQFYSLLQSNVPTIVALLGSQHRVKWPMSLRRCEWRVWVSWVDHIRVIHFTTPHRTVYGASWATPQKKPFDGWDFSGWKIDVHKVKGLIVRSVVWEHSCGSLKVPLKSSQWSSPGLGVDGSTLWLYL